MWLWVAFERGQPSPKQLLQPSQDAPVQRGRVWCSMGLGREIGSAIGERVIGNGWRSDAVDWCTTVAGSTQKPHSPQVQASELTEVSTSSLVLPSRFSNSLCLFRGMPWTRSSKYFWSHRIFCCAGIYLHPSVRQILRGGISRVQAQIPRLQPLLSGCIVWQSFDRLGDAELRAPLAIMRCEVAMFSS